MNQRCILERWYTYRSEYLREFETEFEDILGCESGVHMGSIIEKNQRSTISCYCTFKRYRRILVLSRRVSMQKRPVPTYKCFRKLLRRMIFFSRYFLKVSSNIIWEVTDFGNSYVSAILENSVELGNRFVGAVLIYYQNLRK